MSRDGAIARVRQTFDSGAFQDIGSADGTWSPWFGHGRVYALSAVHQAVQLRDDHTSRVQAVVPGRVDQARRRAQHGAVALVVEGEVAGLGRDGEGAGDGVVREVRGKGMAHGGRGGGGVDVVRCLLG